MYMSEAQNTKTVREKMRVRERLSESESRQPSKNPVESAVLGNGTLLILNRDQTTPELCLHVKDPYDNIETPKRRSAS